MLCRKLTALLSAPANDVVEYEYRRITNDTRFLGPPKADWNLLMEELLSGKSSFWHPADTMSLNVPVMYRNFDSSLPR